MVRVFLVYESAIVRAGLHSVIGSAPGVEVVGEACDLATAIDAIRGLACDVVVVDVNLPEMSTSKFAERVACSDGAARILVVPSHGRHHHVDELLRSGIKGFLDPFASTSELLDAIEIVADGRYCVSESITQNLIRNIAGNFQQQEASSLDKLSNRERQTLSLVAEGLSSKEIASQLGLSTRTIETYRQTTMSKLQLHKTADLVRFAIREGLAAS